MTEQPLKDILVLDFSTLLAGPVAATFLGDFGAQVIKIEEPGTGEFTRMIPLYPDGRSPSWLVEGRNKRCITLNLRTAEGQAIAHRLAEKADVAVMNFRPGQAEAWGLGAEDFHRTNPNLIILQVSAYGQTGPYAGKGGFDRTAQAFAGTTYVTGYPDRPPVRSGYALVDYMTSYLGAFGVMTALYNRDLHGAGGEVIDISLVEAAFRASEASVTTYSLTGKVREREGNRNPLVVPADDFEARDGRTVVINAGIPKLWKRLVQAMGRPDLLEDPRFLTPADRIRNQEALYEIVGEWVKALPAAEVVRILDEVKVPADTIRSVADLATDPHLRERKAVLEREAPGIGKVLVPGVFPKLARHPGEIRFLGARLGEHNEEIYRGELGMTAEELATLREKGVI
jgi:crotonobetainyl-CoA:carnitine CoA-transferase CaiB-like acyl-CoA transferase